MPAETTAAVTVSEDDAGGDASGARRGLMNTGDGERGRPLSLPRRERCCRGRTDLPKPTLPPRRPTLRRRADAVRIPSPARVLLLGLHARRSPRAREHRRVAGDARGLCARVASTAVTRGLGVNPGVLPGVGAGVARTTLDGVAGRSRTLVALGLIVVARGLVALGLVALGLVARGLVARPVCEPLTLDVATCRGAVVAVLRGLAARAVAGARGLAALRLITLGLAARGLVARSAVAAASDAAPTPGLIDAEAGDDSTKTPASQWQTAPATARDPTKRRASSRGRVCCCGVDAAVAAAVVVTCEAECRGDDDGGTGGSHGATETDASPREADANADGVTLCMLPTKARSTGMRLPVRGLPFTSPVTRGAPVSSHSLSTR